MRKFAPLSQRISCRVLKTVRENWLGHTLCVGLFLLLLSPSPLMGQSTPVEFGQNRVQHREFRWQIYPTDNFEVYFPNGGQEIGNYVVQTVEDRFEEVVDYLDYRLPQKINLMVFPTPSDLAQTNIGIKQETTFTGESRVMDYTIFVDYNGSIDELDTDIRRGITQLLLERMLFGSDFQEFIQNAVKAELPKWYIEGLTEYIAQGWSMADEGRLRDGILTGAFSDMTKLDDPSLAFVTRAFLWDVERDLGKESLSNLIYLTRVSHSFEQGIQLVRGVDLNTGFKDWYTRCKAQYQEEIQYFDQSIPSENEVELILPKNGFNHQPIISPDGSLVAVVNDLEGRRRVYLYALEDGSRRRVFSKGFRTDNLLPDRHMPLITFAPDNTLDLIHRKRDKIFWQSYDVERGRWEKMEFKGVQNIYDFRYVGANEVLMSVMQNGQSNILSYNTRQTRRKLITNDFYDDLNPIAGTYKGQEAILFASNRPNDTLLNGRLDSLLPQKKLDVFMIRPNHPEAWQLIQLTHTHDLDEFPVAFLSDSSFLVSSDVQGIRQFHEVIIKEKEVQHHTEYIYHPIGAPDNKDSVVNYAHLDVDLLLDPVTYVIIDSNNLSTTKPYGVSRPVSQYQDFLQAFDVQPMLNPMTGDKELTGSGIIYSEGRQQLIPFSIQQPTASANPASQNYRTPAIIEYFKRLPSRVVSEDQEDVLQEDSIPSSPPILYQSRFDFMEMDSANYSLQLSSGFPNQGAGEESPFEVHRKRNYSSTFMTESVSASLDNSLLYNTYQPFNPGSPVFDVPGINGLLTIGITDLMEDHKIYGGVRLPTDFQTRQNEMFATYEALKKRMDHQYTYYRKSLQEEVVFTSPFGDEAGILNTRSNYVEYAMKYALDVRNSIRLRIGFRNDRFVPKSLDVLAAYGTITSDNYVISKLEYCYDASRDVIPNIKHGLRAVAFFEAHKEVPVRLDTIFGSREVKFPQFNNDILFVWGFDARHYQPIWRTITWANRLAYSSSVGSQKLIYYLGGSQGILFPQFNQQTPINTDNGYVYQALASSMRGFQQNIRNGNSFMVLNSEFRVPIFSSFSRKIPNSPLLRNLQVLAFCDIGSAWEGPSPFGKDNPLYQQTLTNAVSEVRLDINKFPVVVGYGFGLRANAFGYFMRADFARGWDSGEHLPLRFQLSLGYDF